MQDHPTSLSTAGLSDPARLEALYATGLLDSPPDDAFDRFTKLASQLLHTEVSLVSLVNTERQFFKSSRGLPEPVASARETPLSHSFCKHVVLSEEPLIVEDARTHPVVCDNPAIRDLGVHAYLGVPLRTPDGHIIGSLCAIDSKPRAWSAEDEQLLSDLATLAMTEIELRIQLHQSKQTEEALQEREERYHLVARATNDAIWDWNLRTDWITWNEAIETLFGYEDAVEAGTTAGWWKTKIHPDDQPRVVESIHRVIRGGEEHWSGEYRFRCADGAYAYVLDRGYLLRDAEGTPIRMIGAMLDLTDHLQTEAALRQSEGRFRSLVEATTAIAWTTPASGEFETDQPGWSVFTGQRFKDLRGWGWLEAVHPEDRAHTAHVWRNAITSKTLYQVEHRLRRYDGVYRHMLVRAVPIIENGTLREWIGIHSDITGTKKTEKALRQQTRVLETVNQVNATLAAELDLGKLVQAVTDAGTELTGAQVGAFFYNVIDEQGEHYTLYTLSGAPREAFSGFPMPRNTEVFHATFHAKGIVRSDDITQDERYGKNAPFRGMPKGHLPVRSYLAAPVVSRSGEVLGGLFFGHEQPGVFTERAEQIISGMTDQAAIAIENARLYQTAQIELAERRRAEQRLKELNETLEQRVAERMAELEHANARLRSEVAERTRAETALRSSEARFRSLITDVIDQISVGVFILNANFQVVWMNQAMARFFGADRDALIGLDKRTLIREQFQHFFEDPTAFAQKVLAAYDDNTYIEHFESHVLPADDRAERWLEHWSKPIQEGYYEGGRVELYSDITKVKQTLQALSQTNAALTHRNRELQEFAYVASHDLQEPLRKIRSFGDLLETDYGDRLDEQGFFYLERMHSAADRMSTLISDLLSFSRVMTKASPFVEIDLNQIIDGVLQDLHVLLEEKDGRVDIDTLPAIEADPTQMRQLFQNLISNALKFRRPDEPPVVRITASLDADHQPICHIQVSDNGIGFEQQYADKIFMPFQRLHGRSAYEGTGIGLAICRRIIERHHGSIHAKGTPGEGSTFAIALPTQQPRAPR